MLIDAEWVALHTSLLAGYLDTMQEEVTSETYASHKSNALKDLNDFQQSLQDREKKLHDEDVSNKSESEKQEMIDNNQVVNNHLYGISHTLYILFQKLLQYLNDKESESNIGPNTFTEDDKQDRQFFKATIHSLNPEEVWAVLQQQALKFTESLSPASHEAEKPQNSQNPQNAHTPHATRDFAHRFGSVCGSYDTFKEELARFTHKIFHDVRHMKSESALPEDAVTIANDLEKKALLLEKRSRTIDADLRDLRTNIPPDKNAQEKEQIEASIDEIAQAVHPETLLSTINQFLAPLDFIHTFIEKEIDARIQDFTQTVEALERDLNRLKAESSTKVFAEVGKHELNEKFHARVYSLSIKYASLDLRFNVLETFFKRHPPTATAANVTNLSHFREKVTYTKTESMIRKYLSEFNAFYRNLPPSPEALARLEEEERKEQRRRDYQEKIQKFQVEFQKQFQIVNNILTRFRDHTVPKIVDDLKQNQVPIVNATSSFITILDQGERLYKRVAASADLSKDTNAQEELEDIKKFRSMIIEHSDPLKVFEKAYKSDAPFTPHPSAPPTHTKQTPPPARFASRVAVFASTLSALAFPPVPTDFWNASDTAKKNPHAKHAKHTLGHSPFLRILCKHVAHIASVAQKHEALAAHRFLLEVTSTSPIVASAIAHAPLTKLEHPNIHALRAHLRDSTLRPLHVIAETVIQDTIAPRDTQDTIAEAAMHPLPTHPRPTTTTTTRRDATREEYVHI